MMHVLLLIWRLALFALWTFIVVPPQLIVLMLTKGPVSYILPRLWHRGVLKIANIKVHVTGTPPAHDHCFFVGNHISAMDIPILGSLLLGSFVAKADVERYPVFGFLASIQQTVFISRQSSAAKNAQDKIRTILKQGKNLILFPEGTSTDGTYVVPFKSTLFSLPIEMAERNLVIQPFTLSLRSVNGSYDLNPAHRRLFTLGPEVEFLENFLSTISLNDAEIDLEFHTPLPVTPTSDRKSLADAAHKSVVSGLKYVSTS